MTIYGLSFTLLDYLRMFGAMPRQRFLEQGSTPSDWEVTFGRWQVIVSREVR